MRALALPLVLLFLPVFSLFNRCLAQENSSGPVFNSLGSVYEVPEADFVPDSTQVLKAIFDIERLQDDPGEVNPLINSLARYINMHVQRGIPLKNIHLSFVLHGVSGKDALSNEAYKKRYGVNNPNSAHIKALAEKGVHMFICGQSATYAGYKKSELIPEVKMALSAMTVLTVYQANGYSLIRF
jgi:intracellular sulfur oxidation DsrE/DsrF family protein